MSSTKSNLQEMGDLQISLIVVDPNGGTKDVDSPPSWLQTDATSRTKGQRPHGLQWHHYQIGCKRRFTSASPMSPRTRFWETKRLMQGGGVVGESGPRIEHTRENVTVKKREWGRVEKERWHVDLDTWHVAYGSGYKGMPLDLIVVQLEIWSGARIAFVACRCPRLVAQQSIWVC
jgi:hypothetical protein